MAVYEFDTLKKTYELFQHPMAVIEVNDKDIASADKTITISDIVVDLTSGYDASIAEFSIYDVYDTAKAQFDTGKVKKFIMLGSKLKIYLGYSTSVRCVFLGVITKINYLFEKDSAPCIRVTGMDVKGLMMSGSYSRQLKATTYSEAVKEILNRTASEKMQNSGCIEDITVADTMDRTRELMSGGGILTSPDKSIEMVAESDYEFVVKAAKKNNYEFFTECGHVYFRRAKSDTDILIELGPDTGMQSFDIAYDLTGLVEKVIVKGTDVSKAAVFSAEKSFSNKISRGNKAKRLIAGSQKVYIDSSVSSKDEAAERAASLMESISYRFGKFVVDLVGLPEMLPGHFINLKGLGEGTENKFYLTRVRHTMRQDGMYDVRAEGVSASIENTNPLGGLMGDFGGLGNITNQVSGIAADVGNVAAAANQAIQTVNEAAGRTQGVVNQVQGAVNTAEGTAALLSGLPEELVEVISGLL